MEQSWQGGPYVRTDLRRKVRHSSDEGGFGADPLWGGLGPVGGWDRWGGMGYARAHGTGGERGNLYCTFQIQGERRFKTFNFGLTGENQVLCPASSQPTATLKRKSLRLIRHLRSHGWASSLPDLCVPIFLRLLTTSGFCGKEGQLEQTWPFRCTSLLI